MTDALAARLRPHFPALERVENGQPVAYFDGPGGTQVPRQVAEAMTDYLLHHNANTHWAYPTSVETDAMLLHARGVLAAFLNAGADEVAFGANMTTLTFHLARALGRGWGPSDRVVITELDHHANQAPWRALAVERGVEVDVVRLDLETGRLDWADLERKLVPGVRLLAIGAASNAIGTVTDVRGAAELARAVGALTFVDATHYAPHRLPDVQRLECDFLACSAYKFCGPHLGVLYGRRRLLDGLDVPKLEPAPDTAPERLETGTQNHEGIVAAAAAVEFFGRHGAGDTLRERLADFYRRLEQQEQALFRRLWDGLGAIPGVARTGVGPDDDRTPTAAFTVPGLRSREVSVALGAAGVFVSHGDFYATTVARRYGRAEDGWVRAGCAPYTTLAEVDRLVEGVARLAGA